MGKLGIILRMVIYVLVFEIAKYNNSICFSTLFPNI